MYISYLIYLSIDVYLSILVGMSLPELRQLYFLLREEVFVGGLLSIPRRTEALERILKEQFKEKRMTDVEFPKLVLFTLCFMF